MDIQREIWSKILSEVIKDERIVAIIDKSISHIEDYPLETIVQSFAADIGDYQAQLIVTNNKWAKMPDKEMNSGKAIDNLRDEAEWLGQQIENNKAYMAGRTTMKDNLLADIKKLQAEKAKLKD